MPAPRKLPPTSHIDLANDPYPEQAQAQGLTGRVLVEFHIDRDGKVVSPQILAADADEMLQKAPWRRWKPSPTTFHSPILLRQTQNPTA